MLKEGWLVMVEAFVKPPPEKKRRGGKRRKPKEKA